MSSVRVIGGIAKGRRLKTRKSKELRPATDYVKEALFNILAKDVLDCVILDLFAGIGSLGIEALSRGAKKAVFVEKDRENAALIKENLLLTGFYEQAEIYNCDVFKALPLLGRKGYRFQIIFADPPFRKGLLGRVVESISEFNLLLPKGIIVTRSAFGEEDLVKRTPYREERYGDSILRFYRLEDE
ncbi:MAG: 16S rRNA (guanine(966)-N(2))-methyltransferase RsmD [Caldanaerobacter sp.]